MLCTLLGILPTGFFKFLFSTCPPPPPTPRLLHAGFSFKFLLPTILPPVFCMCCVVSREFGPSFFDRTFRVSPQHDFCGWMGVKYQELFFLYTYWIHFLLLLFSSPRLQIQESGSFFPHFNFNVQSITMHMGPPQDEYFVQVQSEGILWTKIIVSFVLWNPIWTVLVAFLKTWGGIGGEWKREREHAWSENLTTQSVHVCCTSPHAECSCATVLWDTYEETETKFFVTLITFRQFT